jgi:hypothetical protein
MALSKSQLLVSLICVLVATTVVSVSLSKADKPVPLENKVFTSLDAVETIANKERKLLFSASDSIGQGQAADDTYISRIRNSCSRRVQEIQGRLSNIDSYLKSAAEAEARQAKIDAEAASDPVMDLETRLNQTETTISSLVAEKKEIERWIENDNVTVTVEEAKAALSPDGAARLASVESAIKLQKQFSDESTATVFAELASSLRAIGKVHLSVIFGSFIVTLLVFAISLTSTPTC